MRGFRRVTSRCQLRVTKEEQGFTLVELLVVMLILGILAAIAIPAFFSQSAKAQNADAQQIANTARKAVMTRLVSNDDIDSITTTELIGIEPTLSSAGSNLMVVPSNAGYGGFAVAVASKTGTYFGYLFTNTRTTSKVCLPAGASGCSATSTW